MKRVLLVKPISRYYYTLAPNLGLGYIASSLRNAGCYVSILDCDRDGISFEGFESRMNGAKYDVVGFQTYTNNIDSVRRQSETVKRYMKDALIIAGGPHASGDPEQTLKFLKDVDLIVTGEGEMAMIGLAGINKKKINDPVVMSNIDNIAYRDKNGSFVQNKITSIGDINRIPMPAWDLINPNSYPSAPHGTFARSFPIAPLITSRGCPYSCTFCASFKIHGRKIRRRSSGSVLDEMEYLINDFGVKEFHIEDDNFTMGKDYAKELLNGMISRKIRTWISLPNGIRIDAIDEELLGLLERAGCYSFAIGIESGSDRILEKLEKRLKIKEIEEKVILVKRVSKIKVTGFFLIGHPDETEKDIRDSIDLALRLKLDRVSFSPLMPLPGSALYEEWKKKVSIDDVNWSKFLYYQFIPMMSKIAPEKLEKLLRTANMRFYLRPRILSSILSEIRTPRQLGMVLKRASKIMAG